MNAEQLRALQAPLKERYRQDPASALLTLEARGRLDIDALTCRIETGKGRVEAGLHPATGGDGTAACSGDMLLEALAGCAGVTLPQSPPRSASKSTAERSTSKATSIFAAHWVLRRMHRSDSRISGCISTSTPTPAANSSRRCSSSPNAIASCFRR
jgi:hypothetical protein